MADATVTSPAPPKRRGWLRAIAWIVGILVVLLVVVYFVATSSAFFKGVILPKVGTALNATVTVSDASISPFSEVVLHNLKVQTVGTEPLVAASEVRLRYSLMDILHGNIHVDEVTLTAPTVVLVENPDGSSNLDPILKAQQQKPAAPKPAAPAQPGKPMQIDVKKVALTDATIRKIKLYKGNNRDVLELSHVTVTLDDLKNGQTGKLGLSADIQVENNPPAPGAAAQLQAKLTGAFTFALTADLKPGSIKGSTHLGVTRAEGSLAQLADFGSDLDCEVTPTDIKQVALRFQRGSTPLGEVRVSGPFDLEKKEGRLAVSILSIDKQLLNLTGAASGIDFGPTTLNCTNEIQLAKAGSAITAAGQLNLNQFQLTRTNQTTPPLDLRASYSVSVDTAAGSALLRTFVLTATEAGQPIVRGELTSPMTFAWGSTSNAVGDSALNLTVTHLNLADWKPFVGSAAPAGDVNLKLQLLSQQAGKQLGFDLSSEIDNLTVGVGTNQVSQLTITLALNGKAVDFKQFSLAACKFQVARQNQPLVTLTASGKCDQANNVADLQLEGQLMLARLLQSFPQPGTTISSGTLDLKVNVAQQAQPAATGSKVPAAKTQNVTGSLALADFTGQFGSNALSNFGTTADFDIGLTPLEVQIRKVAGKLTFGGNTGGSFALAGTYGLSNKSAQITAKLTDFNQTALRPFLEPMLADKKLVSVAINGDLAAQYNPQGGSSVKGGLQVTNLVVNDPKGQFPATPLAASMQVDASLDKQVANVRRFSLSLTPTARATNQVQLSGQVDMTQTNAIQGNLKLAADSLDLTSYYDLFMGQKKPAGNQPASTARQTSTAAAPTGAETEPPAKQLPFRNFTAEANIGHLYLHEVEIANMQVTTKLDGGHVAVNPCKLTLNGAPANSTVDLDLGVPGYKYDVSFNAQAVPLAPLVDTFQPERKGQIGGSFSAQAKVSGAGITGPNLQKSLAGQFDMSSTNLNLSVVNLRSPMLKTLIDVVSLIPELLSNPAGAVGSLLQGLTGKTGGSGGLADDLSKSPIDSIILHSTVGSGVVNLKQATVQSSAFRADATGTITLAPVLTNSALQIPVTVALSRPIAQRLNLTSANTATNDAYVKLPDFFTEKGTIGKPEKAVNSMALLGVAAQSVGGAIPSLGNKAGGVLQGLGGLLGGGTAPAATNNAANATTNPPAATQSPVGNLLNQFLKPRK